MITFDHLTKKYGSFTAVNDLSFEVSPEQSVALWGPNGAGKTTAIKCLLGLFATTARSPSTAWMPSGRARRAALSATCPRN